MMLLQTTFYGVSCQNWGICFGCLFLVLHTEYLLIFWTFLFYFKETVSVERKNVAAQHEGFVRFLSASTIILSIYF